MIVIVNVKVIYIFTSINKIAFVFVNLEFNIFAMIPVLIFAGLSFMLSGLLPTSQAFLRIDYYDENTEFDVEKWTQYVSDVNSSYGEGRLLSGLSKEHAAEAAASIPIDEERIKIIQSLPKSTEKRVVSFSLYGSGKTRYTVGAIENTKIVKTYFPGWVCRFYLTGPVDDAVQKTLKELGAELIVSYGSMFSRFLVASDPTVDRYIIRDADSRLSSRDR